MEEEPEEAQDAALAKCESIAERIRSAVALASAASRGQALAAEVDVVSLEQVPRATRKPAVPLDIDTFLTFTLSTFGG